MSGLAYVKNPLTAAHCRTLDQVLLSYPQLKATFQALERCGMDCSQYLAQLEYQYGVCVNTRREFNPLAVPLDTLMAMAPQGPIKMGDAQCNSLDSVIQAYPSLEATILAIGRCGADCSILLDQIKAQHNVCGDLKREFNPLAA